MRTAITVAAIFLLGRHIYLKAQKRADAIRMAAEDEAERIRNSVPQYNPNADNWQSAGGR